MSTEKKSIWAEIDKDFQYVSAYAVLDGQGKHFGTVTMKFPVRGEGRLKVYLHLHGFEAKKGVASGWGYDKPSKAVRNAALDYQEDTNLYEALDSKQKYLVDQLASSQTESGWREFFYRDDLEHKFQLLSVIS